MKSIFTLIAILSSVSFAAPAATPAANSPVNRVASIFVAESFINDQIAAHSKSELVKDLKISLDSDHRLMFLRGRLQVPTEELRAVNLDPALGAFNFQVTIKPETTPDGFLILEFPLAETFFYPAVSKHPKEDRIIIPVQLISLALASIRGYLSALSGDFSGFNRRTAKLEALKKSLEREIKHEKNKDALEEMKNQREALRIQLAAVPIERKQLEAAGKQIEHMLGLTGEKELNLNNELGARRNALIFKIKLSQIVPYLSGVSLGGVRLVQDKKDGGGEHFLGVDVNSDLSAAVPPDSGKPAERPAMKTAPSLVIRLNQALFESESLVAAEKKAMGSKLSDFTLELKDDGLHVSGKYKTWFFHVPFETVVDFVSTTVDVFEVRVREAEVAGINVEFLSKFILESVEKRLSQTLKGICTFNYVGELKDHSRALQVTVQPKTMVPAFPDLHLVGVDVRDHEFLLKIGRP